MRACVRVTVSFQRAKVDFVIHTLPCIRHTAAVNDACLNFKLRLGLSAETSGGLLAMCVLWRCVHVCSAGCVCNS